MKVTVVTAIYDDKRSNDFPVIGVYLDEEKAKAYVLERNTSAAKDKWYDGPEYSYETVDVKE